MKNIIEKTKDFLYDKIDYVMMLFVIIIVVLVINWRLGGLFAKDVGDIVFKELPEITDYDISTEPEKSESEDKDEDSDEEDQNENHDSHEIIKEEFVDITIPSGSLPTKIADILIDNGLIDNKDVFIDKIVASGMDTKLQSGNFKIPSNSDLEKILKILTD